MHIPCYADLPIRMCVLFQPDTDVIACWAPGFSHPQVHDGWIKPGDRDYTEDDVRHVIYVSCYNLLGILVMHALYK